jgi:hypothetical protein
VQIQQFNPTAPEPSVETVKDFLAGRVPRRKNFAGSFGKRFLTPSNKDFLMRQLIHKRKAI